MERTRIEIIDRPLHIFGRSAAASGAGLVLTGCPPPPSRPAWSTLDAIHHIYAIKIPKLVIVFRIERETPQWWFYCAAINSFWDMDALSWNIADFVRVWPLTSHNWVTYWPRIIKNAPPIASAHGEQSVGFLPLISMTLSSETRGGVIPAYPIVPSRMAEQPVPARVLCYAWRLRFSSSIG